LPNGEARIRALDDASSALGRIPERLGVEVGAVEAEGAAKGVHASNNRIGFFVTSCFSVDSTDIYCVLRKGSGSIIPRLAEDAKTSIVGWTARDLVSENVESLELEGFEVLIIICGELADETEVVQPLSSFRCV
jgi:hypothetical protein